MILLDDEAIHPIGHQKHWQESWYFNWSDVRQNAFGVARIGLRFNENRIDGLIFTIRDGKPEFAYPAVNVRPNKPWFEYNPIEGISARGMRIQMIEPLRQWRLQLEGRNKMDLTWTAFTPAFDYAASVGEGPPEIASAHFEQSGTVTGHTTFKGERLAIDGVGQRDKSWGVRDWENIVGWTWISAQFGTDFSFNIWEAPKMSSGNPRRYGPGEPYEDKYIGGFVFAKGANRTIVDSKIEIEIEGRAGNPRKVTLVLTDDTGTVHNVVAHCDGVFPMAKNGLWIQEAFARFERKTPVGAQIGIGVVEHTFQVGRTGILKRAPEVASTIARVLLR
jgi:hypothetical protein